MTVTLYTSRVVLDKLGVVDYGIYGAVGGVVAMLGFLNGTLSTGTSRFIAFELGANDGKRLKATFNTAFYTHLALAIIIAIILETVGMWFLYNKLIVPSERLNAAAWTLHFSILTTAINITQVPYTSVIIAHENMKVYAYLGIFEALARLGVVFLLSIAAWDKLIYYAALVGIVQLAVAFAYRYYSSRVYIESHLQLQFDKSIFKKMLSFSGWSLIANLAQALGTQGYVVLINMFFQPAIVAAQTIGNQITNAMMQFVNNFTAAINPQIIKLYAAKNYVESRQLNLRTTVYVFDLVLLLALPAIVAMDSLLHLWLVDVPPYAVVFARYIVVQQVFNCFNGTFYTPMIASGELKWNSYACVIITFGGFALLYALLKHGCSVMFVQYVAILQTLVFAYFVKPYICYRRIEYPLIDLARCYLTTFKVAIVPVVVCIGIFHCGIATDDYFTSFGAAFLVAVVVAISAYVFLDAETKAKVNVFVLKKINYKKEINE